MNVNEILLLNVKQYVLSNYKPRVRKIKVTESYECKAMADSCFSSNISTDIKRRVKFNLDSSWQQSLFNIIDEKVLDEVEVYKRAQLTKQTFSKIRSDTSYHPDKDTAIRLCLGLKLNIDETLDLLGKAGYTLSKSIKRDLVIRYFIENEEYDVIDIDCVLEEMKLKQLLKY